MAENGFAQYIVDCPLFFSRGQDMVGCPLFYDGTSGDPLASMRLRPV